METTLKDKQAVKATVEVTAGPTEVDAAFDKVLSAYARQVRVPGFRPGKAPRGVLVKRIGEEALAEEVREALIDDLYPQAIREHDLTAIHAHAHGGNPSQGEAFRFELHVDLYPDFDLPELSEIVLDTEPEPIGEEQVQETVENLRREHATQVPVDRPAEAGDLVLIETVGADDAPSEEGSVMPADLETVGEELAEQLDADDEFAKTLGFEAWAEVVTAIRGSLAGQAKERADEERREELVEKLMEHTEVELPPYLVNRRKMQLLENLARDLQRQGMQMDAYLQKLGEDGKREEFDAELQESAERGVKRDLVLEKLLEVRPVEVNEDEFRDAVRYLAAREGMDAEALRRERGEEWLRNYHFLLMRDKALRLLADELASDGGNGEAQAGSEAGSEVGSDAGSDEPDVQAP